MNPRTGRPKIGEERLDIDVKVRFDKQTHDKLLKYCEQHGISRTEAIRRGIHLLLSAENENNGNTAP